MTAEQEFDASVMDTVDEEWPINFSVQASPDGLASGTGRWRVYHNCSSRDVETESGSIHCRGCGQTFTYSAESG